MWIKKKDNRRFMGILLFVFMISSMISANALENQDDDILVLKRDKAVEMAVENSIDLKKLELGYKKLKRQYFKMVDISEQLEKTLDALEDYEELYDKEQKLLDSPLYKKQNDYNKASSELKDLEEELKELEVNPDGSEEEKDELKSQIESKKIEVNSLKLTNKEKEELEQLELTIKEKMELQVYKEMFVPMYGSEPPSFSKKKKFELFIKNMEFPWYAIAREMDKLKLTSKDAEKAIKSGVIQLCNGILQIDSKIKIQEDLYYVQKKQYNQLLKKTEKGQEAEINKVITENKLKKLKLSIENDKIDKENLEIQLKKITGLNISKKIDFQLEESKISKISKVDTYIESALENRSEIKKAELDLKVKKREFDITDKYLYKEDMGYKEAYEALYEKEQLLYNTKRKVTKNIKELYMEAINKKEQFDLVFKKLEKADKDLYAAKINYESGFISMDSLWMTQFNKLNSQIQYDIAKVAYNQAVYNLEKASAAWGN